MSLTSGITKLKNETSRRVLMQGIAGLSLGLTSSFSSGLTAAPIKNNQRKSLGFS